MRRCAVRWCPVRPLPVPVPRLLAIPVALALCAACSDGPPRDHLDAAEIDAFFDGLAEATAPQKTMTPPIYSGDGIDKFFLRDLQAGRPVPDAEWLSAGQPSGR